MAATFVETAGMDENFMIEWACTRLVHELAAANDATRWEDAVALFTDEGLFTRPTAPDEPIVGREAILAAFCSRPPRLTRHFVSNIFVTVEDVSSARAHSLVQLYIETEDGRAKPPLIGEFHDRFVLTPAGWRFSERRGLLVFRP